MTREQTETPLPTSVEHALTHPELGEPTDAEFEELARSIERRIADVTPGRGDDGDWLFRAPLPLGNGELVFVPGGEAPGIGAPAPRAGDGTAKGSPSDHRSLKEIAEAAIREEAGAQARHAREPALEPHRNPARSGIHLIAIANSVTAPTPSMQPRAGEPGPLARPPESLRRERPLGRFALWVSGTLALAAGLAVFLKDPARTAAPVVVTTLIVPGGPPARAAAQGGPASAPERVEAQSAEQLPRAEPEAPAVAAVDPRTLPSEPERVAANPPSRARAPAATPERSAEAPKAPEAVVESEPRLVPAAELGSKPSRPSVGAAQAAVGSTLGAARLCIVGQLVPSYATVVFGSEGRVLKVQVSGPAAGTPAEGCIQRAMQGSRVQPFADETFSVKTTVRP